MLVSSSRRTLGLAGAPTGHRQVACLLCRLVISYDDDEDGGLLRDVLATHWFDDHALAIWRAEAARARGRLWKQRPELLDQLTAAASPRVVGGHQAS